MSTSIEVLEKLREKGFEPTSYSGRGMFGKSCIGVYVAPTETWKMAEVVDLVGPPTLDSLGKGVIVYWPHLEWPESEGVDDEPG